MSKQDATAETGGTPAGDDHPMDTQAATSSEDCRVLLVGELNPYGADPEFALYCHPVGCSGFVSVASLVCQRTSTSISTAQIFVSETGQGSKDEPVDRAIRGLC